MWRVLRNVAEVWCHAEQSTWESQHDGLIKLYLYLGWGRVSHRGMLQWTAGRVQMQFVEDVAALEEVQLD